MNKLSAIYYRWWRHGLMLLCLGLLTYVLFFHNLGHLVPDYSRPEVESYSSASNWHTIIHEPLQLPFKALLWITVALGHHSILQTRVVSACFGVIAALLFYLIIRHWKGYRVAFLSTLLFATSAGFLHVVRLGTADVLQMSVLAILALVLYYKHVRTHQRLWDFILVCSFALLCYVPSMLWFELLVLATYFRMVPRHTRSAPWWHIPGLVLWFGALLAPLGIAIFHTPVLGLQALGLPTTLPSAHTALHQLGNSVLSIGIHSNGNALAWVGHAPLLNVVELALLVLGGLYYVRYGSVRRAVFLFVGGGVSLLLYAFGGIAGYGSLVVFLYMGVAAGLYDLLARWLNVFPRNPIARAAGVALVCAMLALSVLYQTRAYFIAWPHTSATRYTFDLPQPR